MKISAECTAMVQRLLVVRKLHDGACNFAGNLHARVCNFDFLDVSRRKMGEGAGRWKRLGEGSEPLPSSVRSSRLSKAGRFIFSLPRKKVLEKSGQRKYDAVSYNVDYYDVQRFDDN